MCDIFSNVSLTLTGKCKRGLHERRIDLNENKMSDGGRGRALLGVGIWKSSDMWRRNGPPFARSFGDSEGVSAILPSHHIEVVRIHPLILLRERLVSKQAEMVIKADLIVPGS
jgi:hypothetical protein